MYTRREFGLLTLSGLALPALSQAQTVSGVRLGVQTYSLRELPRPAGGDLVEPLLKGMTEIGFTECELWAPQIEPAQPSGRGRPPEDGGGSARLGDVAGQDQVVRRPACCAGHESAASERRTEDGVAADWRAVD